jgi:uncharacterized protein with HEPN domain
MPKDDAVFVGRILDVARRAHQKVENLDRAQFDADENLRLAVTHLIQVIGEAASRVSKSYCDDHPTIPWKAIVGMRNKVVHNYLSVDEDIVRQTAKVELPTLIEMLEKV